ncbi:ferrous iron transport protein A [Lacrimispora sp. NSJ-141]|uniref:Ferrous iron transport protein A n=2 Tax=Lientehia hominis TaxID=2897778 RepID=A0AAP2RHU3_9FIRM|nr:FeoA family protein [Lientehia hominis]MCD2491553.1 ferrous iron transport protein A [Lientehia hominis]
MMPLTLAVIGEENMIRKVSGKPEVRAHLENLGFVPGGSITVVSTMGGNLIVNVKDSRVAISREMAGKIMVQASTENQEETV